MIQLFFKTSTINPKDWEKAYQRILSITTAFPLRLLRIESYNGWQDELNKDHFDLRQDVGTPDERLSFYGDWTSHTSGTSICFFKNWEKHVKNELRGESSDPNKPITWYPHYPFSNDGTLPKANGASTKYGYIDTGGALYEYAILAIGIMLENALPNTVFLTAMEQNKEHIEEVITWLEGHFKENFDLPIHFDKKRLLASFIDFYDDKAHAVCRMEHLYRKQHKRNMIFALENIGYKPSFDCYAEVLSENTFGTWGFADVLDPWIAATEDLESTLNLIAASKKLTLKRGEKEEVKEYDLTFILKQLLKEFILWTPLQREELAHFYTNKEALETGDESLWGTLLRMSGRRLNICPMYATQQELFEAFMFHEPKKGAEFKKIIDKWVVDNAGAFDKLKQTLAESQLNKTEPITDDEDDNDEDGKTYPIEFDAFINQVPKHEQFLMTLALSKNPVYGIIEKGLEDLRANLKELAESDENKEHVKAIKSSSKKENIQYIRMRLKKVKLTVNPLFEQWLNEEKDENVLFYLTLLMSIKMYTRSHHYVRYRLLSERRLWDFWRNSNPSKIDPSV